MGVGVNTWPSDATTIFLSLGFLKLLSQGTLEPTTTRTTTRKKRGILHLLKQSRWRKLLRRWIDIGISTDSFLKHINLRNVKKIFGIQIVAKADPQHETVQQEVQITLLCYDKHPHHAQASRRVLNELMQSCLSDAVYPLHICTRLNIYRWDQPFRKPLFTWMGTLRGRLYPPKSCQQEQSRTSISCIGYIE